MSWMQKLYETYERCAGHESDGSQLLMPIGHTMQRAQIEVVLDGSGNFLRASILADKNSNNTMIPCTEASGGRAGSKPVNHPLCDKLQYVAGDFVLYGGEVTSGFGSDPSKPHQQFLVSLREWAEFDRSQDKLKAILSYAEKGHLVADLVEAQLLPVDGGNKLLTVWSGEKNDTPAIFGTMQNTQVPGEAFVRWRVEGESAASATSDDQGLISSWITYYQQTQSKRGCCMVTGEETALAVQHPAKLRNGGDKAKLISSNDTSGFTFLGRFITADEVASVGFDVTQKAHNALRWLIARQGFRNGDQVFVSWAVAGKPLPNPFHNTLELLGFAAPAEEEVTTPETAQEFARRLSRAIAGYGSKLDATDDVVVLGLDSATPGRMGITFYRELHGSEFLERIEEWHRRYAWHQYFGKGSQFVGAPAPRDIAEAAYGKRLDENLRKATIERLLPCIVDRSPIPRALLLATMQRAVNRAGVESWEWEKALGIACSLFRGHHSERNYQMSLEPDRISRDYLYGRLIAVADNIENYALLIAGEKRDTTAARLMQRFADRPCSTWRTIEMALRPSMSRLRSGERSAGFLIKREKLLDEITDSFPSTEFTGDARLGGEFLLGYHCQRRALWQTAVTPTQDNDTEEKGTNHEQPTEQN